MNNYSRLYHSSIVSNTEASMTEDQQTHTTVGHATRIGILMEPTEVMLLRPCQLKNLQSTMRGTTTTNAMAIRRTGVDTLGPICYNTRIDSNTQEHTMTRTEKQEAIDAKYNELCSALTAFDFHLRELTGMFDPQIDNILQRTQGVHDLLMEIDEKLVDEFGE